MGSYRRILEDNKTLIIFDDPKKNIAITSIFGCLLWCFASLFFGGYLSIQFDTIYQITLWQFILIIILYFGFWIGAYAFASARYNDVAFGIYVFAIILTGYMQGLILETVVLAGFDVDVARFVFIFVIGIAVFVMSVAILIGLFLINRETANRFLILSGIGVLLIIISELVVVLIFGTNTVFMITTPILIIAILAGTASTANRMFDKDNEETWMVSVIQLTLDFIVIVARLFMYFIKILTLIKKN